ncbi:hypothetical protein SAMN02745866_00253 [Alteromonadaceae bacterium Bs31]|nr:hypothetical protein SAMN02745866_00253 [Alteromonadaceae bacterium Bs31]
MNLIEKLLVTFISLVRKIVSNHHRIYSALQHDSGLCHIGRLMRELGYIGAHYMQGMSTCKAFERIPIFNNSLVQAGVFCVFTR